MAQPPILAGVVVLGSLMGCSSAAPQAPLITSDFRPANAQGAIPVTLVDAQMGNIDNRVGFAVGQIEGGGVRGYAGLSPATTPFAPQAGGSAAYDARYSLAVISSFDVVDGNVVGTNTIVEGAEITLNADFSAKTINGTDDVLSITGSFAGTTLDGTVIYDGVDGTLTGTIGRDDVVGAFHGSNDTTVFAGGFVGDIQTD